MPINLKNYTTEVPANRSIELIEKLLVDFGATDIAKTYLDGQVSTIQFRILIEKIPMAFRLPANTEACFQWLRKKKPNSQTKTIKDQSVRLAWKHQYELLFIQLTGIELQQCEPLQALLPYVFDPGSQKTFYQTLKEKKFTALLPSSQT